MYASEYIADIEVETLGQHAYVYHAQDLSEFIKQGLRCVHKIKVMDFKIHTNLELKEYNNITYIQLLSPSLISTSNTRAPKREASVLKTFDISQLKTRKNDVVGINIIYNATTNDDDNTLSTKGDIDNLQFKFVMLDDENKTQTLPIVPTSKISMRIRITKFVY